MRYKRVRSELVWVFFILGFLAGATGMSVLIEEFRTPTEKIQYYTKELICKEVGGDDR